LPLSILQLVEHPGKLGAVFDDTLTKVERISLPQEAEPERRRARLVSTAGYGNSMGRVENKIIIVTAAGAGIGRASSLMLSREGATVWAVDIDAGALDELKRQDERINTVELDVLQKAAFESLAEQLGAVDVLFNCAGYVATG